MKQKYIVLFALSLLTIQAMASRIDKGYEALYEYDYFKAKKYFSKGLKYNEVAASQGLAIIYFRTDNPFHNYDSALLYIQKSILGWDMTKSRKKEKYAKYGFTEDSLHAIRNAISTNVYASLKTTKEVSSLSQFITVHKWANENSIAVKLRDSIAFFQAVESNNSANYKSFADSYPKSAYTELALQNYYDVQYIEQTQSGSLSEFESFVSNNPSSPLKVEAEMNIFNLTTAENRVQDYINFIETYTASSYVDTAWMHIFQLSLTDYSASSMDEFMMNYPQNTMGAYVSNELQLVDSIYLPYIDQGKFGFMSMSGEPNTEAIYDYVGFYREGLAIVSKKDRFGFIDKSNNVRIPMIYSHASEFVNGRAIVEINDKIGVIDRNGNYVFECIYDDVSTLSEGYAYAELDGKYGYYDARGKLVIPHRFDDAYDFKDGKAKVEFDGKQAFIDTNGVYVVQPCYTKVDVYYDTLYTFLEDGFYGVMNDSCSMFVEPIYSYIGSIKNGLAIASMDNRIVYLDALGQLIIDNRYETYPNYRLKGEFEGNTAVVFKEGKYGRIDKKHNEVSAISYTNVGMGDNYYPAQIEGKWGLYNSQNEVVVSPAYDAVQLIDDQYLIASKNDTVQVIDVSGQIIIPAIFDEIELLGQNLFLVKQNGKLGVYHNTKLVAPVVYDQIGLFDADFLFLNRGGDLEYLSISDKRVIGVEKNE